ncbi:MAG: methyltransferase domain-containing protein [Ignavibacteriaceae bacterium]
MSLIESTFDLNDEILVSVIDDLPLWSAPFGLKLLDAIDLKPNLNVLDIGSGMGFPIIELSQRLGNSCNVFGIDPWNKATERAKLKMKIWGITNLQIIEGKAEQLPFENDYFDLIISNNGTNNVDDEEKVFSELSRTTKSGAQLVITVNLPETMIEFYEVYKRVLIDNNKIDEVEKLKSHIHSKRKPLSSTKELIENAGFEINEIFEDSFSFRFLNGSTMFNHFFIRLAFMESWRNILNQNDDKMIFDAIENELNKIAEAKRELSLTIPWVCINSRKK